MNRLIRGAEEFGDWTRVYNGVDILLSARLGGGQLIEGGVSSGRTSQNTCFTIDSPQQERPGFCDVAPPWGPATHYKFMAVQPLPGGFDFSVLYKNIMPPAIEATAVFGNAQIAPSLGRNLGSCRGAAVCNGTARIPLLAPFSLYGDRLSQLDLRLTKVFTAGGTRVRAMVRCLQRAQCWDGRQKEQQLRPVLATADSRSSRDGL